MWKGTTEKKENKENANRISEQTLEIVKRRREAKAKKNSQKGIEERISLLKETRSSITTMSVKAHRIKTDMGKQGVFQKIPGIS